MSGCRLFGAVSRAGRHVWVSYWWPWFPLWKRTPQNPTPRHNSYPQATSVPSSIIQTTGIVCKWKWGKTLQFCLCKVIGFKLISVWFSVYKKSFPLKALEEASDVRICLSNYSAGYFVTIHRDAHWDWLTWECDFILTVRSPWTSVTYPWYLLVLLLTRGS